MKGKVQTVLGPVDPDQLGLTLTHEHLLHDLPSSVFRYPRPSCLAHLQKNVPISLENFAWVQRYPYAFDDNKQYGDAATLAAVKADLHWFKKVGGGTIVDNCSFGLRTDHHPEIVKEISKSTGVHVVVGTGYYVTGAQPTTVLMATQEQMEIQIRSELLDGIGGSDVKCGVIGEIGCCWPLSDFEKKSLRGSAVVQSDTGCPVIVHPGRDKKSPYEIVRLFQESGGDIKHTVMSHLDRTLLTKEELADFAASGCYLEFDLFGVETSHYQPNESIDMPSDAQRIERILYLVQQGFGDKIVIAHDIHTKHRLMKFGGHGFCHIIVNVLPKMLNRGFTESDIKKIMYFNPKNFLEFK